MIHSNYDFNEEAQVKLLALFIREPEHAFDLIKPGYFSNPIHMDISRLAKEVYKGKDLKTNRLEKASLRALVWAYLKKERRSNAHHLKRRYMRAVREIFEVSLGDRVFMLELAEEFSKEGRFRDALIEAEKDVNNRRYDRVLKRFQDAAQTNLHQTQSVSLPVYHVHRLISGEEDPEKPSDHLVYPIIPRGGAVLLYGLPKELKSWFAAALTVDAACGRKALEFFLVERPVKTLYIQVEDPQFLTAERLGELVQNQGRRKPVGMLKVIPRCPLNLMEPGWLAALTSEIEHFRPELIVFDVFRRLFRGNVADSQETAEFLRVLDTLRDTYGCAVLLVHHAKKGETSEIQSRALGSVNLTAWADVLIYTGGKQHVGTASVADIYIESKTVMLDKDQLRIVVDSAAVPMVRIAMSDQWTKKLSDGRTVVYTMNIEAGTGGMITARVEEIKHTKTVQTPMTREEVEARFKNL
jgi:hypothetical protein